MKKLQISIALFFVLLTVNIQAQTARAAWSKEQANAWYASYGWLRGCDFIPSTAINQLEMWQAETFDSATINRELGYAESIGLNCMRVFLHHVAWEEDPGGFKNRVKEYLSIADRHHIITMFISIYSLVLTSLAIIFSIRISVNICYSFFN